MCVAPQAKDVLELMLMTQYFDMLRDVGSNGKNATIFVPHTPGAIGDLSHQIRNSLMEAGVAGKSM